MRAWVGKVIPRDYENRDCFGRGPVALSIATGSAHRNDINGRYRIGFVRICNWRILEWYNFVREDFEMELR